MASKEELAVVTKRLLELDNAHSNLYAELQGFRINCLSSVSKLPPERYLRLRDIIGDYLEAIKSLRHIEDVFKEVIDEKINRQVSNTYKFINSIPFVREALPTEITDHEVKIFKTSLSNVTEKVIPENLCELIQQRCLHFEKNYERYVSRNMKTNVAEALDHLSASHTFDVKVLATAFD